MNEIALLSVSEESLIAEALSGLHDSTGISGKLIVENVEGNDADVVLHVAGRPLRYRCELKQKIDRYMVLDDLKARSVLDHSTLLISGPLTDAMASRCRELDIQFIDTAGNAYVTDGEGILISVMGRKIEKGAPYASRAMTITPAAIRMMFAFLAKPSMLNAPYREISVSARVSTGTIGNVFAVLEARGFIGTATDGRRILISPELMLSEWATGYLSRLRPKLKKFRFTAPNPNYVVSWNPRGRVSAWGGEVAAQMITQHLNPATFTIYMDMEGRGSELPDLVKQYRLRADSRGEIEVVQPFWNMNYFDESFPTVPLHLIYADLLGTQDPRNLTVASKISREVIKHVHDSQR